MTKVTGAQVIISSDSKLRFPLLMEPIPQPVLETSKLRHEKLRHLPTLHAHFLSILTIQFYY